jgi:hypothetical protein
VVEYHVDTVPDELLGKRPDQLMDSRRAFLEPFFRRIKSEYRRPDGIMI